MKNIKFWAVFLALTIVVTSCVNDGFGKDDWGTPEIVCHNKYDAPTMTLANFVAQAPTSGTMVIVEDQIIDGYVVSSDENGNFYKTISFQDSPENPTVGLQIEVNRSLNYIDFPIGTHIRINAKGLVLGMDKGVVKLGATDPDYAIGRISENQLGNHISVVCVGSKADVAKLIPLELNSLANAKSIQHLNKLVSVSNVQFSDADILGIDGVKSFLNFPKADTSRDLVGLDGATATLRTASYASFGSEKLPIGNGKITFVVSRYNNNYQMVIRGTNDINFSVDRVDTAPAKGGSAINYLKSGSIENFTSYTTGASSEALSSYINDPVIGNRYWRVANFGGNKYIQLGFPATGAKPYSRTLFAVPVDFDNMMRFSFKTKDGYYNGDVLKVYYSKDYKPNAINPTLVDITSAFTISRGTTSGYASSFIDSGNWEKPSTLSGRGFIIFEYIGGGSSPTTTMQIDDIVVQ